MKAMILSAGRGRRMQPLTDTVPKPLLEVRGKALIDYHLEALARAGITHVVINTHYLGHLIEAHVGDGARYGLRLSISVENELLETAGGIKQALPILGTEPFIVVSGDIFCGFEFADLPSELPDQMAHLVMVDNPAHHPRGDFTLENSGRLSMSPDARLTYGGIGVYSPAFFDSVPTRDGQAEPMMLRTLFYEFIASGEVTAEKYAGSWSDVGTPERLQEIDRPNG